MREGSPCLACAGGMFAMVLACGMTVAPARAEPLRPIRIAQTAEPGAAPSPPVPQPVLPAPATPVGVEPSPPSPAPVNEEEQQTIALLVDLQRYTGESNEELRRDLAAAIQALNRARTEPNRIRVAVLLTLPGAGPPDDARAIALLESVSGKTPGHVTHKTTRRGAPGANCGTDARDERGTKEKRRGAGETGSTTRG